MNKTLKEKVRKFLEYSEINKTIFCRKIDMSQTTLNAWLRGEREISVKLENRIINFMTDYIKRLMELAK